MSLRLTNKQHFLYWGKKVRNYRGSRKNTLRLYSEYLKKLKSNPTRRPIISDFFPTFSCRKLSHYLERGWLLDDAKEELIRIQGGRMDDPIKKAESIRKMLDTCDNKPLEEKLKIHESRANNFSDPIKMANKYDISLEDALKKFENRKARMIDTRKKTLESMGGYNREWSHWCWEHWVSKGYDVESAKKIVVDIHPDTRSVVSIMDRYDCSEEDAVKFFNSVTDKGKKTFDARPQHEKDEILLKRTRFNKKYSMASSRFFHELLKLINLPDDITIRMNEDEYFLWDYENKKVYFYDFCIPQLNIMIEYNGIMFHPRQTDTIFVKVEDSIKKDTIKDQLATHNNFQLYWYWENIDDKNEKLIFYAEKIKRKYEEYNNITDIVGT